MRKLALLSLLLVLLASACTTPAPGATPTNAPPTPQATVPSGPDAPLFVIEQVGGIAGFCDRVELSAAGVVRYSATCKPVDVQVQAPAGLLAQLQAMAARLAPVSRSSEDNPGGPDNMKTTIILNGTGTAQATEADIEALGQIGQVLLALVRNPAQGTATVVPTAEAGVPEAVWISAAAYAGGSVHVAGEANPTFEQNLVVRVLGEDGQELAVQPTTIAAEAGQRGTFSADVPVPGAPASVGYVQVFYTSARDGGILHLVAVDLLQGTPAALPANREAIVITAPALNATVSGVVAVTGIADPTFEQTLLLQVFDADGNVIGQASGQIQAENGRRGPFSIQVPLKATTAGPGRVTVSDASARDGSLLHLSSVEVQLALAQ